MDVDRRELQRAAACPGSRSCSTRPSRRSTSRTMMSVQRIDARDRRARRARSCAAPLMPPSGLRISCARPEATVPRRGEPLGAPRGRLERALQREVVQHEDGAAHACRRVVEDRRAGGAHRRPRAPRRAERLLARAGARPPSRERGARRARRATRCVGRRRTSALDRMADGLRPPTTPSSCSAAGFSVADDAARRRAR